VSVLTQQEIEEITQGFIKTRLIPAMQAETVDGMHCHVVVVTPGAVWHAESTWKDVIACQESVDLDDQPRAYDFNGIARSKAGISIRTGLPSRVVVQAMPQLLRPGETIYGGSAVVNGWITAISGFEEWEDESLAGELAYRLWCRSMSKLNALRKANLDFIPS
jgi:hypothetical protein